MPNKFWGALSGKQLDSCGGKIDWMKTMYQTHPVTWGAYSAAVLPVVLLFSRGWVIESCCYLGFCRGRYITNEDFKGKGDQPFAKTQWMKFQRSAGDICYFDVNSMKYDHGVGSHFRPLWSQSPKEVWTLAGISKSLWRCFERVFLTTHCSTIQVFPKEVDKYCLRGPPDWGHIEDYQTEDTLRTTRLRTHWAAGVDPDLLACLQHSLQVTRAHWRIPPFLRPNSSANLWCCKKYWSADSLQQHWWWMTWHDITITSQEMFVSVLNEYKYSNPR